MIWFCPQPVLTPVLYGDRVAFVCAWGTPFARIAAWVVDTWEVASAWASP